MSYAYLMIPAFLLITPMVQTNFLSYATDQAIIPTGETDKLDCPVLGGAVINQTIGTHSTLFCKFESRFLSYYYDNSTAGVMLPSASIWKDPHTGDTYTFPYGGTTPISKNATGTYYIADRLFNIVVKPIGEIAGSDMILAPHESKIEIISWGKTDNNSLTISFPNEMLSGEIKVTVDGNGTDSHVERTDTTTTITIPLDFSHAKPEISNPEGNGLDQYLGFNWRKIEITATQMTPEFPFAFVALVVGIAVPLAITKIKWNQISSFPK